MCLLRERESLLFSSRFIHHFSFIIHNLPLPAPLFLPFLFFYFAIAKSIIEYRPPHSLVSREREREIAQKSERVGCCFEQKREVGAVVQSTLSPSFVHILCLKSSNPKTLITSSENYSKQSKREIEKE